MYSEIVSNFQLSDSWRVCAEGPGGCGNIPLLCVIDWYEWKVADRLVIGSTTDRRDGRASYLFSQALGLPDYVHRTHYTLAVFIQMNYATSHAL